MCPRRRTIRRSPNQRRRVLRLPRTIRPALATALAFAVGGCDGVASTLDPAGPRAQAIADITWLMTGLAALVFAIVVVLLAWAVWRGRHESAPSRIGGRALVIAGGVALPVLMLPGVYVLSLMTMSALSEPGEESSLVIDVTAFQWGYDATYPNGAVLANEIRIPVGEPVLLRLHSRDVIHSFWVPRLAGKQDFIPGQVNEMWIEASEAGVFPGRCAEFCGVGHARMELEVLSQDAIEFRSWLDGASR